MTTDLQALAEQSEVSPWVRRWAHLVAPGERLLDLACGGGRHARFFAARGVLVDAVDGDAAALSTLPVLSGLRVRHADLEGADWPLAGETYDAVLVCRYLYRPRWIDLLNLLRPAGVLIYETFARGNEALGRPKRADFLLETSELLDRVHGKLRVVAFEEGRIDLQRSAVLQRIVAVGPAREWPLALNFFDGTP